MDEESGIEAKLEFEYGDIRYVESELDLFYRVIPHWCKVVSSGKEWQLRVLGT